MDATWLWVALLGISVVVEVIGRVRPGGVATLRRVGALVAVRVPGRLLLVVIWVFVGIHLFARYTVPRH
jgi:hypothetical protein